MTEPISDTRVADAAAAEKAAIRLDTVLQRHAGWQIEYDVQLLLRDRKRLEAELARALAERDQARAELAIVTAERGVLASHVEVLRSVHKRRKDASLQLTHAPGKCPTPCDDDCDSDCHEEHQIPAKRTHQPPPTDAALPDWVTGNGGET